MPIRSFRAENFRCLTRVAVDLDPQFNLVFGANASGKTSLLESIGYLGRGKSFRGAPAANLIRHGTREFVLFGTVDRGGRDSRVGVRNSRDGLEVRIDGDSAAGAAGLAEALPLQVIDPEVHDLVSGGPENRRRYIDWMAFHVEHGFLEDWRRLRRALKQRNAALRGDQSVAPWTAEFVGLAQKVDAARRAVLDKAAGTLTAFSEQLLGTAVGFEYRQGWPAGRGLGDALEESAERDRQQRTTLVGPHRADLVIQVDERQARRLVSRGQQKLLACALVLAATEMVRAATDRRLLLLLDDPAAELDSGSLERLMGSVYGLDCQVIATALDRHVLRFPDPPAMFHVEHGDLSRV